MDAALAVLRANYGGVWVDATPKTPAGVPLPADNAALTSGGNPRRDGSS